MMVTYGYEFVEAKDTNVTIRLSLQGSGTQALTIYHKDGKLQIPGDSAYSGTWNKR